jgi:hypothetical protein
LLLSIAITIGLRLSCILCRHYSIGSHLLLILSLLLVLNLLAISCISSSISCSIGLHAIAGCRICCLTVAIWISIGLSLHSIARVLLLHPVAVTATIWHYLSSSIHHRHLNCHHPRSSHGSHLRIHSILLLLILRKRINNCTLRYWLNLLLKCLSFLLTNIARGKSLLHLS